MTRDTPRAANLFRAPNPDPIRPFAGVANPPENA